MCDGGSTYNAPAADPKVGEYYEKMGNIGAEQWAYMKDTFLPSYLRQQDKPIALGDELTNEQIASSRDQRELAGIYRGRMQSQLFPVQDAMAAEAMAAGSPVQQALASGKAQTDVTMAFDQARGAQERRMAAMGVNPASGAYQSDAARMGVQEALAKASAGTRAREAAVQLGWAKKADVAASLQGMIGGQATAAQTAMSGYGSANGMAYSPLGAMTQGAGAYTSGMSAAGNMFGGAGSGFQGLSNYNLNAWNMGNQASNQQSAGMGSFVGQVATAGAIAF